MKRIVTHTDFDGLISALLLREILRIEPVVFSEPWLIQKGEFEVLSGDVIVDLPYDERCTLWIDHHASSKETANRLREEQPEKVVFDESKKSCPSLLQEHFDHPIFQEPEIQRLIIAADKIDSADFTKEELKDPDVFGKISISLKSDDKRKDDEYRQFLLNIMSFMPAEKVVEQPLVKKRVEEKKTARKKWEENVKSLSRVVDKVVVVDYTLISADADIGDAAPFMIYTIFPQTHLSITIGYIKDDPQRYKVSVGKNIFYDGEVPDIGELMKARGGGGHKVVGGCSFPKEHKEIFLTQLLRDLKL